MVAPTTFRTGVPYSGKVSKFWLLFKVTFMYCCIKLARAEEELWNLLFPKKIGF